MSLNVSNISLSISGRKIIDDVSFVVEDGQFVSLLGQSGAGKSTMLRIVSGITLQDEGTVSIDGINVDNVMPHKRRASIVFQDIRLFPHMTLEENVAFPLKMQHVSKRKRLGRARELLEMVHLGGMGARRIDQVSGGQQQRAALARALAGNPRLLLLDEPFSGLDENLRDEMRRLVLRLHRSLGTTAILVTHDAHEALMMSDRIVYMDEGRVVQSATPHELFAAPATEAVALCFGDCCSFEAAVEGESLRLGELRLPVPMSGDLQEGPARAVIRNGAVTLVSDGPYSADVSLCVYSGESWQLHLDIGAGSDTLVCTSPVPVDVGERVRLALDSTGMFVYPA